jgi:phosphomannomutase
MTLVQLKHLITLAETGSFSRSAEALFLTQPALSRSIRALEDDLGLRLFDRSTRHVSLTAEGENFRLVERLKAEGRFEGATEVITIDGVRVVYPDGFGLARPSNTTPVVVMRFEADSDAAIARIQAEFKTALLAAKPDAKLTF